MNFFLMLGRQKKVKKLTKKLIASAGYTVLYNKCCKVQLVDGKFFI